MIGEKDGRCLRRLCSDFHEMWRDRPLAVCFWQNLPLQQRFIHTDCETRILLVVSAVNSAMYGAQPVGLLEMHGSGGETPWQSTETNWLV